MYDLLIRNARIVNGNQRPFMGSVAVAGGKIVAILPPDTEFCAAYVVQAGGKVLFPGAIDPHVHYRYDRGYQNGQDDYLSETRSALVGGITTAIRMHRELGPYAEHIPAELQLLESTSHIDMAFHLAIMTEDQLATFHEAATQFGITSFKLYLAYKGKAGKLQGLQGADDGFLYEAMRRIGKYPNGIACVHCENSEIAERLGDDLRQSGRNDLKAWTEARPGWAEGEAIHRAGYIAHHAECPLYVVHTSSAEGIEEIEALRSRGIQVRAEVCIHHLTATVDEMESSLGALAKVNPPLRSQRDIDALWDAVRRGVVDTVGTDHVPHTSAKNKPLMWDVMPGFSGSGTMLASMLTEGYHRRGIPLERIAALVSGNAAHIFNLRSKGEIVVGGDADLTLIDLDLEREVRPVDLKSVADFSLAQGRKLKGWATLVTVRGEVALQDGQVTVHEGHGKFVVRN